MRHLMAILAFSLLTSGTYAQNEWEYGDYTKYQPKKQAILTPGDKMAHKWSRGFVNLVTGVAEIPVQTVQGYRDGVTFVDNETGSRTLGTGLGLLRGFGYATGRIGHGAFEMLTFWGANPTSNDRLGWQFDSTFAWEFREDTKLKTVDDRFQEKEAEEDGMFDPVGRKIVRGAEDTFLGASELWYQPKEAYYANTSVTIGVCKGVWMFLSREVHGVQDLVFCLLPNPERQVGITYTIPHPWNFMGRPVDEIEDVEAKHGLAPVE